MNLDYKYTYYVLDYLKKYYFRLVLIFFMSIVIISLSLVPIELFKRLIDIAIPTKDIYMVVWIILAVFVVHIILLIINYIQDLMLTNLGLKVRKHIQIDFFSRFFKLPSSVRNKLKKGQLMERMIEDTDDVVDSTFDLVLSPILDVISLIIVFVYMFLISPRLTIAVLAFVPIFILVTIPFNRLMRTNIHQLKKVLPISMK
ncbi:MAG: ABC transporter ATP-binding protein [Candidatus Woesearchaeota archaeon]